MCIIFIIVLTIFHAESSRILVIVPTRAHSHVKFARAIYTELAVRGHEIIAFNPFYTSSTANLQELQIDQTTFDHNVLVNKYTCIKYHELVKYYAKFCEGLYTNDNMKALLSNPNEKFDLVMIEWNVSPCFSILKKIFNAPLVGFRSVGLRLEGHDYIANPTNPSYLPIAYGKHDTSFFGRFNDLLFSIFWRTHHNIFTIPYVQKIVNTFFRENKDDIHDLEKHVDLILTNTNYVVNGARPLVPAMVEVGFLQVGIFNESLNKDLQEYLDRSKNGFILFNVGTLLTSEVIGGDIYDAIVDTFKQLPYNILWKYEGDVKSNLPINVKVMKWIPQESVLAHPNIKCFISHGGLNSMQESIYYEVPIIIIPFLFDQPFNAHRVQLLGIGKSLEFQKLNTMNLKHTIMRVSQYEKYRDNLKYIKNLVQDGQIKPMDKAMWWIEYVIRHKGNLHNRSTAVYMNWVVYLGLDIILFCFVMIYIILFFIWNIVSKLHKIFVSRIAAEPIKSD